MQRYSLASLFPLFVVAGCTLLRRCPFVDGFVSQPFQLWKSSLRRAISPSTVVLGSAPSTSDNEEEVVDKPPAPVLNGKRILPLKIIMAGLKGHRVSAAYAVLSSEYKQKTGGAGATTTEGWEACQHVGVSTDLAETLRDHLDEHGVDRVAHVRALSFMIPNESAMESIASDYRREALEAKGATNFDPVLAAMDKEENILVDDVDNDVANNVANDGYFDMMAGAMMNSRQDLASARGIVEEPRKEKEPAVISPFDRLSEAYKSTAKDGESSVLPFNKENVDTILDEIRPYLISDGGNVSVERVDAETKDVYLKLEGACGSCPSSTVTMQMGIERVLKEKFAELGEVLQVEEEGEAKPAELTLEAVQNEVNRIKPAIIAMGGGVEIMDVDPGGVIKLKFRGASKVRQGLELALLDLDFAEEVEFLEWNE